MTEHGLARRGRRRDSMIALVFGTLVLFAGLSFRIGPLWAALCVLAVVTVPPLVIALIMRRMAGDGWAASLPRVFAHRLGLRGAARHGVEDDQVRYQRQEFLGRLVIDGDVLRWEPREADRRRGMTSLEWQRPWHGELVRLRGPGRVRCLTLPGPDGEPLDIWLRDPHNTAARLV
ncbi:hypothetical protein [Kutzneria buriramensis]|uniref:Uncharacterized protein n=1 Tax=Kutzneria buriramensis TaxID=1045776 RepID=A0A3E0GWV3_9PSEU|nr:hypothetical protein [Kutzneria buriramensis]REH32467.1 hypothetical protein BCF44_12113 [Kutzneria buriramensis]